MRTIDVLRKWCKIEDPKLLESEVIRFESAILAAAEAAAASSGNGIEVLPGVRKLLDDLSSEKDKRAGEEKWAICTSSTYFYAGKAIPIAGLTTPKIFVTAESVTKGKPAPDRKYLRKESTVTVAYISTFSSLSHGCPRMQRISLRILGR